MERGLEIGIYLRPDIDDDNFVAAALGNLAAYRLQRERKEPLVWQVLRVQGTHHHHYRLVIRHPTRILDLGLKSGVEKVLNDLSNETLEELRHRLADAEADGLKPVPLRAVAQEVDYWRDDFWNWLG